MVVLVSEPVGGRSRATELPCFKTNYGMHPFEEILNGGGGINGFVVFFYLPKYSTRS